MDDNSDYGVMPSRSSVGRSDSQSDAQSVPSEEGSRSRTNRVSGTQTTTTGSSGHNGVRLRSDNTTGSSGHNGVRLRSDSFGNNNVPPPMTTMMMMMMMDNPCVPDSMKVAAALVGSNSGRIIRAPEDDSSAKKGRTKNLFKRKKDKKATGVASAPAVDTACAYA